jgi:hypothetical protein
VGAKLPGYNGKIGAEVDAGIENELIETAENTYEGAFSHTIQESTERQLTILLKGAPEARIAHLRKRYWRHTWDVYLHSYDYLELEFKKKWLWKKVRKTIKQASSSIVMLPLFRIEFFEPQVSLNVSYNGVDELEDPYGIRIIPLNDRQDGSARPNLPSLEESARLAFPVTRAEKAATGRRQAAKRPARKKSAGGTRVSATKHAGGRASAKKHGGGRISARKYTGGRASARMYGGRVAKKSKRVPGHRFLKAKSSARRSVR